MGSLQCLSPVPWGIVIIGAEERNRVIAAAVFHQKGFEEIVGYRKTIVTKKCVSKFLSL